MNIMRLLLIEDEEKTSTYMSGFIASTPPGQEVMPIMGWVCRLCAPSLLCTGEMPLPVVKVASIHLASPLRCKRIKRRTIYGQTGNKVAAGAVQSVIGVTFIYE
ncbi:hypothetical protein KER11_05660 [Escherichia coli]|nr:hypothetical protein [Escherichia coli]